MTKRTIRAQVYPQIRNGSKVWRYRIIAGNGEITAPSQAYSKRSSAVRGAVRNNPAVGRIEFMPSTKRDATPTKVVTVDAQVRAKLSNR